MRRDGRFNRARPSSAYHLCVVFFRAVGLGGEKRGEESKAKGRMAETYPFTISISIRMAAATATFTAFLHGGLHGGLHGLRALFCFFFPLPLVRATLL